jgi:biopolymer transport protein ExbD
MQFTSHQRRRAPTVIIVSLIDVLLVVLIFLMVTTTFKKLEPALQLALPQSQEASLGKVEPTAFVILVATNSPYFYFKSQPISLDHLRKQLTEAARNDPKLRVDIKADKRAPFGEVIKVIDAAKEARVGSINAITEKRAGP